MASPEAFCEETRAAFAGVITKPPLTDKLLSRPPFKFVHDVVKSTIKAKGFLDGYFTADELDSDKVSADKDAKLVFLQRLIDAVQTASQTQLDVQAKSIAAGKDADKTNLLLQTIAQCAKTIDADANTALVKKLKGDLSESGGSAGSNKENRVTNGVDKPVADADKEKSEKRHKSQDKDRSKDKDRDKEKKEKSSKEKDDSKNEKRSSSSKDKDKDRHKDRKDKHKDKEDKHRGKDDKDGHKEKDHHKDKDRHKDKEDRHRDKDSKRSSSKDKDKKSSEEKSRSKDREHGSSKDKAKSKSSSHHSSSKAKPLDIDLSNEVAPSFHPDANLTQPKMEETPLDSTAEKSPPPARPGSSVKRTPVGGAAARPGSSMGRPGTSLGRPGTAMARPAPPKLKRKELGEVDPKLQRQNGVPDAAVAVDGGDATAAAPHLIVVENNDAGKADEDEEDVFVIEDDPMLNGVPGGDGGETTTVDADELDSAEHGGLVRKILETKKELESGLQDDKRAGRDTFTVVFDEKEREKTRKEAARLQEFIQKLTRSAHPLSRLLDYLQEDIDSMLKELEQWRAESRANAGRLTAATAELRAGGDPYQARLVELDGQIAETRDAVAATRGKILANELRLNALIGAVGR